MSTQTDDALRELELRRDPPLEELKSQVFEAADLGTGELQVGEIGERSTSPQPERRIEQLRLGLVHRFSHCGFRTNQLVCCQDDHTAHSGDWDMPAAI